MRARPNVPIDTFSPRMWRADGCNVTSGQVDGAHRERADNVNFIRPANVLGVSRTAGPACRSRSGMPVATNDVRRSEWRTGRVGRGDYSPRSLFRSGRAGLPHPAPQATGSLHLTVHHRVLSAAISVTRSASTRSCSCFLTAAP